MQCIITEKQPNQLTNCDETKERVHNSLSDRPKENKDKPWWAQS